MRAHYNRAIVDDQGNLIVGCSVRVIDPATSLTLSDTLFAGETGSTSKTNPFVADDGVVDFYLDAQARVRLGITRPEVGSAEYYVEGADVLSPV